MINRDFNRSVAKLYRKCISKRTMNVAHSAMELLSQLHCKVTQPVGEVWRDGHLFLIYYNVSLDIASDLSSCRVTYNSDYTMLIRDLQHDDIFQLSEFILALEQDIPQWNYIWTADEKLRHERIKFPSSKHSILRDLQMDVINASPNDAEDIESKSRIRYYNLKAKELMLENENPYWKKCSSEKDILEKFVTFHIIPPMEQWLEEWNTMVNDWKAEKAEQLRMIEEERTRMLKERHLIKIKHLMIQAYIDAIELHQSVAVEVIDRFNWFFKNHCNGGHYLIKLKIDDACANFCLPLYAVDPCIAKLIESIKKVNDLVPELRTALVEDDSIYSLDNYYGDFGISTYHEDNREKKGPFELKKTNWEHENDCDGEPIHSIPVVDKINSIINDLRDSIKSQEKIA